MPLSTKLDRKLQPADDSSDGEDYYEVTDRSSSESFMETGEGGDVVSSEDEGSEGAENRVSAVKPANLQWYTDQVKSDASDDDRVQAQISKVSFGALAKAHDALAKDQPAGNKRKRGDENSKSQEDKLEALRERLRQIKAQKLANAPPAIKSKTTTKAKPTHKKDRAEVDDDDDSDNSDSESNAQPKARSSKHAPAVQSSKRMVSRKRKVVDVKKPVFRDPRFENVSGPRPDEHAVEKRYAFLNDYRVSEIAELKSTIKKSKNEAEKERLKKKLLSMESQQKTRANKEKQQDVIREHKKKEKELVKDGKQPFYLKKCKSLIIYSTTFALDCILTASSRAKEDCLDGPLPEHEVQGARTCHRASSQEGHCQGAQEHARRAENCMILVVPPQPRAYFVDYRYPNVRLALV